MAFIWIGPKPSLARRLGQSIQFSKCCSAYLSDWAQQGTVSRAVLSYQETVTTHRSDNTASKPVRQEGRRGWERKGWGQSLGWGRKVWLVRLVMGTEGNEYLELHANINLHNTRLRKNQKQSEDLYIPILLMAAGQRWGEELSVASPSNVSSWRLFPPDDPYCDQTWFVLFQTNYLCGLAWEHWRAPGLTKQTGVPLHSAYITCWVIVI